jgi:hypothetical protein
MPRQTVRLLDPDSIEPPPHASRRSPMICSVVNRFRAIPFSPHSRLEIAGFAQSAWHRFREAVQVASVAALARGSSILVGMKNGGLCALKVEGRRPPVSPNSGVCGAQSASYICTELRDEPDRMQPNKLFELARQYGCYGCRKIAAESRVVGWHVNDRAGCGNAALTFRASAATFSFLEFRILGTLGSR